MEHQKQRSFCLLMPTMMFDPVQLHIPHSLLRTDCRRGGDVLAPTEEGVAEPILCFSNSHSSFGLLALNLHEAIFVCQNVPVYSENPEPSTKVFCETPLKTML